MNVRRLHRILGLILLLPICAWAATGFIFFVKPGYGAAYSPLRVRTLPLEQAAAFPTRPAWLEMRAMRTVLGAHLLVRTESGWAHLDPETLRPLELPDESGIRALLGDAIAADAARYGQIASVVRNDDDDTATATTTTGVAIDLDWTTLSLSQSGRDTRLIDALYRVHYLQWTGLRALDRVIGVVGLVSLLALAVLGLRLALPRKRASS